MADSLIVELHSHSAYYSEYLCVTCRVQVTCNTVNPVCTILDFWTLNFQVTVISTIIAQNLKIHRFVENVLQLCGMALHKNCVRKKPLRFFSSRVQTDPGILIVSNPFPTLYAEFYQILAFIKFCIEC